MSAEDERQAELERLRASWVLGPNKRILSTRTPETSFDDLPDPVRVRARQLYRLQLWIEHRRLYEGEKWAASLVDDLETGDVTVLAEDWARWDGEMRKAFGRYKGGVLGKSPGRSLKYTPEVEDKLRVAISAILARHPKWGAPTITPCLIEQGFDVSQAKVSELLGPLKAKLLKSLPGS